MSASAQCPHLHFSANVKVARIEDTGLKYAELTIRCNSCGLPALFRGLPAGMSPDRPTASPDSEEVRLPFLCEGDNYTAAGVAYSISLEGAA